MPNVRITAGSIDENGNTIWGTGDFLSEKTSDNIYIVRVNGLDTRESAVTCSLNNLDGASRTDDLITFSKLFGEVRFSIQSVGNSVSNVRDPFDFIIVSSL